MVNDGINIAILHAVGRYCEYRNKLRDRSDEFDTFDAYKDTLELFCLNGTSGQFTWTPDDTTPDVVYYQVVIKALQLLHRFLIVPCIIFLSVCQSSVLRMEDGHC